MKISKIKSVLVISIASCITGAMAQPAYQFQSPEVWDAWRQGYKGQGAVIAVHDNFSTIAGFNHGAWTATIAAMTAPSASVVGHQNGGQAIVGITANKLNIFNLSYGYFTAGGAGTYVASTEAIVRYAQKGQAVVTKAAGNDSIPVGGTTYIRSNPTPVGTVDGLSVRLAGQQSAILVGALSTNGTPSNPARMASYSNTAGTSPVVQSNFLVVGVNSGALGGLQGTSFAAPIVAGYAAIVGSKFTTASPTAVANQLLNTARTDTVVGYNPAVYGRGEASLSRALAPASIR